MNNKVKKRLIRIAVLSLIAFVIGAGFGWFEIHKNRNADIRENGSARVSQKAVPGVVIGGNYTLIDHTGKTITQADYKGQYKLIYFGFTYCPAICPTELQKISKVMNALGEEGKNIQPLFITVDPERDTVDVMAQYVELFHPKLIGLTGTNVQIANVMEKYKIFARKVKEPEMNDYTMDHSSFIYFMGPEDTLLSLYRIQDEADFITEDIRAILSRSQDFSLDSIEN